jgi:uncharacterized protein YndB with AHSA1/START domain
MKTARRKKMTDHDNTAATDDEIVIARDFDAPRDLLYETWTQSDHIQKWLGPDGFETRVDELHLRPGGKWRYVMIGPDGDEYPSKGMFLEVAPHRRIVTTDEFDYPGVMASTADLPRGMIVAVDFEDLTESSRLTVRINHRSAEDREKHENLGVVDGWNSSLDHLAEYLFELQHSTA